MVDWGITIAEKAQRLTAMRVSLLASCSCWSGLMPRSLSSVPAACWEGFSKTMASNGIRIAIVGGGLAGLAAAMKIAEAGHNVDLFSVVPVKRSHSVCAQGGINGRGHTKAKAIRLGTLRRHGLWRRLPRQSTAGKAMCEMRPRYLPLRSHGRSFSRTQEATRLPSLRRPPSTTALLLPELRLDNNCSTLWTNKCAASKSLEKSGSLSIGKCFPSFSTIIRFVVVWWRWICRHLS